MVLKPHQICDSYLFCSRCSPRLFRFSENELFVLNTVSRFKNNWFCGNSTLDFRMEWICKENVSGWNNLFLISCTSKLGSLLRWTGNDFIYKFINVAVFQNLFLILKINYTSLLIKREFWTKQFFKELRFDDFIWMKRKQIPTQYIKQLFQYEVSMAVWLPTSSSISFDLIPYCCVTSDVLK